MQRVAKEPLARIIRIAIAVEVVDIEATSKSDELFRFLGSGDVEIRCEAGCEG